MENSEPRMAAREQEEVLGRLGPHAGLALLVLLVASPAEAGSQFFRSAEAIDDRQRIVIVLMVLIAAALAFAALLLRAFSVLFQRIQLGCGVLLTVLSG